MILCYVVSPEFGLEKQQMKTKKSKKDVHQSQLRNLPRKIVAFCLSMKIMHYVPMYCPQLEFSHPKLFWIDFKAKQIRNEIGDSQHQKGQHFEWRLNALFVWLWYELWPSLGQLVRLGESPGEHLARRDSKHASCGYRIADLTLHVQCSASRSTVESWGMYEHVSSIRCLSLFALSFLTFDCSDLFVHSMICWPSFCSNAGVSPSHVFFRRVWMIAVICITCTVGVWGLDT